MTIENESVEAEDSVSKANYVIEDAVQRMFSRAAHARRTSVTMLASITAVLVMTLSLVFLSDRLLISDTVISNLEEGSSAFLWISIFSRVFVIVLGLFFVQLLVGIYRYNARLSGYYEARADALLLLLSISKYDREIRLGELVEAFSPQNISFERTSKTSIGVPIEAIEEAVKVTKKTSVGSESLHDFVRQNVRSEEIKERLFGPHAKRA